MSVLGIIHGPKGHRFELTREDALWAGRMIVGEGEDRSEGMRAVVSTMLRRLVQVGEREGRDPIWDSFTTLVVGKGSQPGYSQPIALQWRGRGESSRIARRKRIRELTWQEISPKARVIVEQLFCGQLKLNAPHAVHFADVAVVERRLRSEEGWRLVPVLGARNRYVSTSASRRAPEVVVSRPCSLFGGRS